MSWTALGGGDHGGNDWIINSNTNIAGVHKNIGEFRIANNRTATVPTGNQFRGVQIEADIIYINGTLSASGAGFPGGNGGGGRRSVQNPNCGESGFTGNSGTANGLGSGGGGGPGGSTPSDGLNTGCRFKNGVSGGNGLNGAYGNLTQNLTVLAGSGGGGAGGGSSGSRDGNNLGFPGGTGGGGGGGGPGGGRILLISKSFIFITGKILSLGTRGGNGTNGLLADTNGSRWQTVNGGNGGAGTISGNGAGGNGVASSSSTNQVEGGWSGTVGGNGGTGGLGSGGGVLLECRRTLDISSTGEINVGAGTVSGVLKIKARSEEIDQNAILPTSTRIYTAPSAINANFKFSGGVLGPNGKIYGIPYNATDILVIENKVIKSTPDPWRPELNKF